VAGFPVEHPLATHDPDDPCREAKRCTRALEHRSLLDVHLDEVVRPLAAAAERGAADAAALLIAKDDGDALPDALERSPLSHLVAQSHKLQWVTARTG
jgi:hypothetical protein